MPHLPPSIQTQPQIQYRLTTVDRLEVLRLLLIDMQERQRTADRTHAQLEKLYNDLVTQLQWARKKHHGVEIRAEIQDVQNMLIKSREDRLKLDETMEETILDLRLTLAQDTRDRNAGRREDALRAVAKYRRERGVPPA